MGIFIVLDFLQRYSNQPDGPDTHQQNRRACFDNRHSMHVPIRPGLIVASYCAQ